MKPGDLVKIWNTSYWGGRLDSGRVGVAVRRKKLAYESKNCVWEVLERGHIQHHRVAELSVITN